MVGAADAGVARTGSVQPLHLLDGQPHRRPRLQGYLLDGLLEPAARPGRVAHHGLWTLAAPPQPGGVVEHGRRLAHVAVQVQRAALPTGQIELPSWGVPVKGRGLGERCWGVPGQRVWGGARRVGVAERSRSQSLRVVRLVGVAGCTEGQRRLPGEAQWAVPLDGELGCVAAELFVVLDDICVRGGDAAGIVDVVVFNVRLRATTGSAGRTGYRLVVVGNVRLVVDQVWVLPLDDIRFRVPFRLLPHRHVVSVRWNVVWVIKRYVLAALFLFLLLLLLLRFLLLGFLWHFGLVAASAMVAQDQAENHQGKDGGTAANNCRDGPYWKDHCIGSRARAADKGSVVGRLADCTLRALDAQTGNQGLARLSCVELGADASETRVGVRHTAALVLTWIGGTVSWWDTLVGVPLIDTHQAVPARVAFTQVGTPAADLDRRTGLG